MKAMLPILRAKLLNKLEGPENKNRWFITDY
jgi:hypothetical protein